jgi:hypothetical protein
MPMPVKLSDAMIHDAKIFAQAHHRSLAKQIEHWAYIGKIAEENPDLPYGFIQNLLVALEEEKQGATSEFTFGKPPRKKK